MFNYRKFSNSAQTQSGQTNPTQSGQVTKPQPGKILNELESKNPSDEKAKQQVQAEAQSKAKAMNNAIRENELAKDTFEKLQKALTEVKESPFSKIQPGSMAKACESLGEKILDPANVVNPDEIQQIYQQYIESFHYMQSQVSIIFSEYQKIKNQPEVLEYIKLPGVNQNANQNANQNVNQNVNQNADQELEMTVQIETELQKMQNSIKLNEVTLIKQQRQFMQFDILYQDMFNYYSLLSRICETKTRYDASVEQFQFGNQEDYRALLSYYEYGISLLRIMAPKAASINPTQAKNIQSYYGSMIEQARAEISKLSIAPLKALYGLGK